MATRTQNFVSVCLINIILASQFCSSKFLITRLPLWSKYFSPSPCIVGFPILSLIVYHKCLLFLCVIMRLCGLASDCPQKVSVLRSELNGIVSPCILLNGNLFSFSIWNFIMLPCFSLLIKGSESTNLKWHRTYS